MGKQKNCTMRNKSREQVIYAGGGLRKTTWYQKWGARIYNCMYDILKGNKSQNNTTFIKND